MLYIYFKFPYIYFPQFQLPCHIYTLYFLIYISAVSTSMLYISFIFPYIYFLQLRVPSYRYTLYFLTYTFLTFNYHAIHLLYFTLHIFSFVSTTMQCIYYIIPYIYLPQFPLPCYTFTLYFLIYIFLSFNIHAIHIHYICLHIFSLISTCTQYIFLIFPYTHFAQLQLPCYTYTLQFLTYIFLSFNFHAIHIHYISVNIYSIVSTTTLYIFFFLFIYRNSQFVQFGHLVECFNS